jgi:acyl dehydratase
VRTGRPWALPCEPRETPLGGIGEKSLAVLGRSRSITPMGNETAAVKRPTGGRRGGATGSQTVGEYTGQRAGDAAQAVRRAGLRPGLERSFGCDPSLLGLVVSQDPAAGSALARNGMVTLHVAAPGTGSTAADTTPAPEPAPLPAPKPRPESEPAPAPAPAPARLDGDSDASDRELTEATGTTRRRRKPGLSGRAPEVFDVLPAPIPPAALKPQTVNDGEQEWGELAEPEPTYKVDGGEFSEETASEEDGFDGLTADEFVVHVDDVFAGRTGRWRPVRRAPRARSVGRGLRERLSAHPWLAGSAAFAVGVWLLLGTLGVLTGQHPAAPARTAGPRLTAREPIARAERPPHTPIVRAPQRRGTEHHTNTQRRALPTRRSHPIARPARAARPRVPTPAPTPSRKQPAAAAPSVPRVSEPAPPPAEQTSGGLFSP